MPASHSQQTQSSPDAALLTGAVDVEQKEPGLCLHFRGHWTIHSTFPSSAEILALLTHPVDAICLDTQHLLTWDSRFLIILHAIKKFATHNNIQLQIDGLPSGLQRLMTLAATSHNKAPLKSDTSTQSFLATIGDKTSHLFQDATEFISFTGAVTLSFFRFVRGRAQFLSSDFFCFLEACGPSALPIVTLISVLVGVILAFVGAVQLQLFGAEIYIANLVGLGMTREMGAMMTAIIMAGRTGAAFAAQLGTMQVNEEVDALQTMGIDPTDFLVLPRLAALLLMMPLLAIWADLLGIGGGFLIAWLTLDISMMEYYNQTIGSINLRHFGIGLFKAFVFGYLVAFSGCLRGMQCGRSASAVGNAATSAVVTAIVLIVVFDAIMTVIFNILGI